MFCIDLDGVRICHLGDLGHQLSAGQVSELGKVDVLLIPVGGFFTIDSKVATDASNRIRPAVVIPMHFKNEKCAFPISGVGEFLKGKQNVLQPGVSEMEFKAGQLPDQTQIVVLKPSK